MSYPVLFSTLNIRGHELRNRAVITSHTASQSFFNPALPAATYIEYIRRRAGSVGLIITQPQLWQPGIVQPQWLIDRHGELAEAVHAEGAKIMLQIVHLGVYGRSDPDLHAPPLYGFGVNQSVAGEASHEMDDAEITMMIEGYRSVARLAAEAGFDGVEAHGGHGYLIQQSLTPEFNSRTDRWGTDPTLFARRIIQAAREEVGPNRIVGYRTTTDDLRSPEDGGIGFERGAQLLKKILATGEVDVLNTTIGYGGPSYSRSIPDYRHGDAPNIPPVERLREAADVKIPIIGTGSILTADVAESVLASGACELVAMTRAHIADPEHMLKVAGGHGHRVRPCVGANDCVNRVQSGFPEITCFHNPEVLREQELAVLPTVEQRKVLVIGAGPAGLKAAEIAARRGHDVHLYDGAGRPGGRLRHSADTAGSALVGSIDYLFAELAELGVKLVSQNVGEGELQEIAPDEVILASGTRPNVERAFAGAQAAGAIDSSEALDVHLGHRVFVYDTLGANEGPLVAEALAKRGHQVTYGTPEETVGPQSGYLHRAQYVQTLYGVVSRVIVRGRIGFIEVGTALVATPEGADIDTLQYDSLVVVAAPQPDLVLVPVLKRLGIAYRVAGDAVAPRLAAQAFKGGHEAGLAV
ncbi:oxidoreductase [Arthrobacter sp. 2MCAF14]|uniref:oxidoreductase n=1 Tax=Arthrobacter sp. 2MCAF14 TaxID=3232982 RepID=UPI003F8DAFA9